MKSCKSYDNYIILFTKNRMNLYKCVNCEYKTPKRNDYLKHMQKCVNVKNSVDELLKAITEEYVEKLDIYIKEDIIINLKENEHEDDYFRTIEKRTLKHIIVYFYINAFSIRILENNLNEIDIIEKAKMIRIFLDEELKRINDLYYKNDIIQESLKVINRDYPKSAIHGFKQLFNEDKSI